MLNLARILIVGISLQFCLITTTFSQTKADRIEELMTTYAELGKFNGSILVAADGQVIYKGGFGLANMEWDIANKANTKHRLGSVTKQFTAMLIMQQVEEGNLKLDVPITTYLPDYPKENGNKITLHHLLTHSSGIPNYTSFPGFFKNDSRNPYTPEEFVHVFADSTLDFEPGEKFSYSNSGYFLLGAILEEVTGNTYEELLHKGIFEPLGMEDTGFDHHKTILKNRATGYDRVGRNEYVNSSYLDMSIPYAAGSMYSTVEDLYLWDQALYTDKLISEKSKELMFTGHVDSWSNKYGYGWGISTFWPDEEKGYLTIGHGGGINGFNTIISRIPEDKNLVVLLNNTGGTVLDDISSQIFSIIYGTHYVLPKKSLAYGMLEVLDKSGLDQALLWFRETMDEGTYELVESEVNAAGYSLLNKGMVKEAIAVFIINTEQFPESANVYDSLGEAYLADGNKVKGLENYKKTVELQPNNPNAYAIIKELEGE
jgi:CubicO group peptidase (beta-lactamase class C family)